MKIKTVFNNASMLLQRQTISQNKCFQMTHLLDWAPLKLVSMTINEKITPEKPIEH